MLAAIKTNDFIVMGLAAIARIRNQLALVGIRKIVQARGQHKAY